MHNIVQRRLAANILLMYKWNHAFLLIVFALAWKWQIFIKKQTWWFTDKAIIELGCLADKWFAPLATNKSRYFAQPRPIIVKYSYVWNRLNTSNVDTYHFFLFVFRSLETLNSPSTRRGFNDIPTTRNKPRTFSRSHWLRSHSHSLGNTLTVGKFILFYYHFAMHIKYTIKFKKRWGKGAQGSQ